MGSVWRRPSSCRAEAMRRRRCRRAGDRGGRDDQPVRSRRRGPHGTASGQDGTRLDSDDADGAAVGHREHAGDPDALAGVRGVHDACRHRCRSPRGGSASSRRPGHQAAARLDETWRPEWHCEPTGAAERCRPTGRPPSSDPSSRRSSGRCRRRRSACRPGAGRRRPPRRPAGRVAEVGAASGSLLGRRGAGLRSGCAALGGLGAGLRRPPRAAAWAASTRARSLGLAGRPAGASSRRPWRRCPLALAASALLAATISASFCFAASWSVELLAGGLHPAQDVGALAGQAVDRGGSARGRSAGPWH